jgi:RNA recognition motif-containing protein
VKQALSVCGKVGQVRLAIWNHTKRKKGFGYVDFINGSSAEVAVNKQGTFKVRDGPESACMYLTAKYFMYPNIGFGLSFLQLKGRVLQLDYDVGKPRSSFKLEDGRAWKKTKPTPKGKKK